VLTMLACIKPSLSHICRFRLPHDIPPSFKGSSLRFSYSMDVKALYEPQPSELL
jgi:hypothetical protein